MAELTINQALQQGVEAHKVGQVQEANRLYTVILTAQPRHPDANHNMGVLAVGVGKLLEALPFFKTALEANPSTAQFWLSYIDALIKLGRLADAKAVFDQAQSKGASGNGFDQLEQRLNDLNRVSVESVVRGQEAEQVQPNILDNLKLDQALRLAKKTTKEGSLEEAKRIYQDVLAKFPKNKKAILGYQKLKAGITSKEQQNSDPSQEKLQELSTLNSREQFEEALSRIRPLVSIFPKSVALRHIQAAANAGLKNYDAAIESYQKALKIKPDYFAAYFNMGNILQSKGNLDMAIKNYKKALLLKPGNAEAYSNMGNALKEQDKLEEAIEAYNKALAIKPDNAEACYNMGIALAGQGKLEEAIEAYNKALVLKPDYAEAYHSMGITLHDQGQVVEAIEAYNKALTIKPDYADAYSNMGNALKEQDKLEEAIEAYNKALAIKPDCADSYYNMGITLNDQGRVAESIEAYNLSLLLKSDNAEAYNNMGNALIEQGKLEEAIEAYNKALSLEPDHETARAAKLFHLAQICDWNSIQEDSKLIPYLGTSGKSVPPFAMLPLEDAPDRHRLRSETYVNANFFQKPFPLSTKPSKKPERIRIGYFSPDFEDHPVAQMIEGVMRHHDRTKFEIFAYSFGKDSDSGILQKIKKSVDIFKDVQSKSAQEIISLARGDRIDIAVDLTGHTKNSKIEIFTQRASPIQINYLGYPETMGAASWDYIIADKILIPLEMETYYSEKVIFMPNSYQPTNDSLVVSEDIPSKEILGLPKDVFVFCAINQGYKINPTVFDIWMRLLHKVDRSVLWLKGQNDFMVSNLRIEAQKRGIDPSRLVFAKRIFHEQYLAQFKQADLYLDTFNYNAGTTASDVLMAGLPIVTKMGESYASRMAASLLNACSMNDLITETPEEYEKLALELAINPSKLLKLRERLQKNTKTTSIFDTALYTRNLEGAYQQAYDLYYSGNSTQNIEVEAKDFSENLDVLS